ncbi:MAG: ferredoxin [Acutalibacteraceae bacterium]|nr:ferredoxin [Bacillota bacterium]
MHVKVNENCIGCGLCVNICPEVFVMTDAGVAAAKDDIPQVQGDLIREAADSCPVEAIEAEL